MSQTAREPWLRRLTHVMRGSLATRLTVVAAAFMLGLIVVALIVWAIFSRTLAEMVVDPQIESSIDSMQGRASGPDEQRQLKFDDLAVDPRFSQLSSGFYYEVLRVDQDFRLVARSISLSDVSIRLTPAQLAYLAARGPSGRAELRFLDVPDGPDPQWPIRVGARVGSEDGLDGEYLYLAAISPPVVVPDVGGAVGWVVLIFVFICALTVAAVTLLQVRFSLAPLRSLQHDIESVRKGEGEQLTGEYPDELSPVANELNALLQHNREVVERARRHVGNLAHALKTPIAVLKNAAESGAAQGAMLKGTVQEMEAFVERQLRRARVAARAEARAGVQAGAIGYRTPVRQNLEDLIFMMEQRYEHEKALDITLDGPDVTFRGEREDLLEMAANLVDNACKYGKSRVAVTVAPAAAGEDLFEIVVEDDGEGLDDDEIALVLQRGARLDEAAPGQGLGLSILTEAVSLYSGELKFERSALGGLKARLRLPATD